MVVEVKVSTRQKLEDIKKFRFAMSYGAKNINTFVCNTKTRYKSHITKVI